MARQDRLRAVPEEAYTRGIKVITTINKGRQEAAYRACAAASWTTTAATYRGAGPTIDRPA